MPVLDALDNLKGDPTVSALGGENAIYGSLDALAGDSRVVEVAVALCKEWERLHDRTKAKSFIIRIVEDVTPLSARDVFDVLLNSEDVLPEISHEFEGALSRLARGTGIIRDFALEAWTRLALGNWASKTLHLRAALQESSEAEDASYPLVRALGAAVALWQDDELHSALETLIRHEDLDSEVAMELGLFSVARAAARTEAGAVRAELEEARGWFDKASCDEARSDAVAFGAVIGGVLELTRGATLPLDRYEAICDCVYAYLDGFVGAAPGWRFPRATTTTAWMNLLSHLHRASTDRWYNPPQTIESLAVAMAAQKTMNLVVNSGISGQVGVRALVQPQVESLARENGQVLSHLRKWLTSQNDTADEELRDAVSDLLAQLEALPPKAGSGSRPELDTIRERLNLSQDAARVMAEAAEATPELLPLYGQLTMYTSPPRYAEVELLDNVLTDCDRYAAGGIGPYQLELRLVLSKLIRFASFHLDAGQSGERAIPWFASVAPWPAEHQVADDLNAMLCMDGLNAIVERPNTAGGRLDIAVAFPRCRICIEVKRIVSPQTDEQLVSSYGSQAVQYAATDIPIAFLVVADYARRDTRLDLTGAFHVSPVRLQPESRQHALTSLRLQANVASPSTASKKRA